jgi:transcriptional regulator with XRE-family HTH domain
MPGVTARQIGVSRNTLRRILGVGNRKPSRRILRQIAAAAHTLKAEAAERSAAFGRLRELAKTEAERISVVQLARRTDADPSNLRKAINGEREFGLKLEQALRRYCGRETTE